MLHFLDKERTVAKPGFNRWLVPPAALAIHLSIGMAYGFSVFWLPLSQAIGITKSAPGDWKMSSLVWIFTLFFVFLGSSAALFGHWLEEAGPRKAGVVAAFCWGGGFFISALGVYYHIFALLVLGSGVIGGCGLGLGYISPVSTLIRWFPDKRGMATGMAIMGFGGGAMIGAPLADKLMKHYASATSVGVWQSFLTLGTIYLIAMLCGALSYRIPAPGWKPQGWTAPSESKSGMITSGHVHISRAHRTPQFWLLWAVLCLNVSAGIGVLAMASPMLQEVFGGKLAGLNIAFANLSKIQLATVASIGAGFAGLLSLFNIGGRIFWASLSDHIGRKRTYNVFFALGFALYISAALAAGMKNIPFFVGLFCVILSMYGGGFATIPAYLADLFGTKYVGAIHGRLLTAWSMAAILGPTLITRLREYQLAHGVASGAAYNLTLYVLSGFLFLGFVSNLLVRPVADRHFMREEEPEKEHNEAHKDVPTKEAVLAAVKSGSGSWAAVVVGWTAVGIPLAWGIMKTVEKAMGFFR
ncbi:MAG: OFA family MFS transporter [Armatimonadota bacterium]